MPCVLHPHTEVHCGQPPPANSRHGSDMVSSILHRELGFPNWDRSVTEIHKNPPVISVNENKNKGRFFINILYWATALGCGVAIGLSGSYSVADPDDYKLYEWLFPWFCGFVQWEQ